MVFIRDPHAAHQLGLADIQRRDPLDDLLAVLCSDEHLWPPDLLGRPLPAGAMGTAGEI
jgi:hypothetical protein